MSTRPAPRRVSRFAGFQAGKRQLQPPERKSAPLVVEGTRQSLSQVAVVARVQAAEAAAQAAEVRGNHVRGSPRLPMGWALLSGLVVKRVARVYAQVTLAREKSEAAERNLVEDLRTGTVGKLNVSPALAAPAAEPTIAVRSLGHPAATTHEAGADVIRAEQWGRVLIEELSARALEIESTREQLRTEQALRARAVSAHRAVQCSAAQCAQSLHTHGCRDGCCTSQPRVWHHRKEHCGRHDG
jgi:hypothetical protein